MLSRQSNKVVRAPLSFLNRLLLTGFLLLISVSGLHAMTPAGTVIKNQASATFKDSTGVQRTVVSNTVETLIQEVAGVLLTQDQSRLVAPGSQAVFPHVLTNSGNTTDSFILQANNLGGDGFDFSGFSFFADTDQNGIADSLTAINSTPVLPAGGSFYFVVVADVPTGLSGGDSAFFNLSAASSFDGNVSMINLDTVIISDNSVVEVTKSISQLNGISPSGSYTITLSYNNPTPSAATSVVLLDALPAGMTYVGGSGRWSKTGATVLTDSNPSDPQGGGADTILFCAYHVSCAGLPEADVDSDSSSINQVSAVLNQVAAGDSGTLAFQVNIDSGLVAGGLINTAEFEFNDGLVTTNRQQTNSVTFTVNQGVSVVANGSATNSADGAGESVTVASVSQSQAVLFDNYIWNTGNGTDTFDIVVDTAAATFPTGTVFQLLQSDGVTPLVDNSGNGIPDTGPMDAGMVYRVVLRATLPADFAGSNESAGFDVTNTATSMTDPSISNSVHNHLSEVLLSTVDLTNVAALGEQGVLGAGAGPEASAVDSLPVDPGAQVVVSLFVNNTSATADTYALSVSTDSTFSAVELPTDWSVQFRDAEANVIGNTGVILPGESMAVSAVISVPESQSPIIQSLYFRAQSPSTTAFDIKHDEIVVAALNMVSLEPDQAAQSEPGATQIYTHLLSNNGNAAIASIDLSAANSLDAAGWTATIYHDVNNNGVLEASDPAIDQLSTLASGASARLFIKVFAPASAAYGAVNITTVSVSWAGGALSVTDQTTINQGDMVIVKEQAIDNGCDNILDSVYTVNSFSLEPGSNCVSYRLTATNSGSTPLFNAVIQDATPAFTTYQPAAVCSAASCTITEPAGGATGVVSAEVATILPGESVEFTFAVVLE